MVDLNKISEYHKLKFLIAQYRKKIVAEKVVDYLVQLRWINDILTQIGNAYQFKNLAGYALKIVGKFFGIPRYASFGMLTDEEYYQILQFALISQKTTYTLRDISQRLHDTFPGKIFVQTQNKMDIILYADLPNRVIEAVIEFNLLPRPLSVKGGVISIIIDLVTPAYIGIEENAIIGTEFYIGQESLTFLGTNFYLGLAINY